MAPCAFLLDAAHSGRCSLHSAQQRPGRCGRLVVHAGGSSFGTLFRVTTFGESHGKGVGCVLDGVPPRLPISKEEIQAELDRRRPGQSRITTPRKESDTCEIYSGALAAAAAVPTPRPKAAAASPAGLCACKPLCLHSQANYTVVTVSLCEGRALRARSTVLYARRWALFSVEVSLEQPSKQRALVQAGQMAKRLARQSVSWYPTPTRSRRTTPRCRWHTGPRTPTRLMT